MSGPQLVSHPPPQSPDEGSAVARQKKGSRKVMIVLIVGALVTLGYFGFRLLNAHNQTTDDAVVEADVVPVAVRVSGQIVSVRVKEDAHVKKGDVILELDATELRARVKQAEGELAAAQAQALAADAQERVAEAGARGGFSTARAQVSTSRAQVSTADAQVAAAKAQLVRAEAEANRAETDLKRTQQLRAANAVTQERLDNASSTAEAARAALEAARAQLAAAEESRRVAQSRVAEAGGMLDTNTPIDAKIAAAKGGADLAHAKVVTAEAALELAKLALSYATVVAPADGTLSRLNAREGQLLVMGQPVGSIVPDSTYVVANFKETQVGEMKSGQDVEVEVDAFPGRHFRGEVESLAGGTGSRFSLLPPDNASGNFVKVVQRVPVRIRWKNAPSDLVLRAGMSAVATVHTGE